MKKIKTEPVYLIYCLNWTEYERGWGNRPDGFQLFYSMEGLEKVKYNDRIEKQKTGDYVPDDYSVPSSTEIYTISKKDLTAIMKNHKDGSWGNGNNSESYLKSICPSLQKVS